MSLSIALDELLSTGWSALDSAGCSFDASGRSYPSVARVHHEFAAAGFELSITHSNKFNCYRAEWRESGSRTSTGSVVSNSEQEAAVYALSQLRRSLVAA
jgi:hypothetical protein